MLQSTFFKMLQSTCGANSSMDEFYWNRTKEELYKTLEGELSKFVREYWGRLKETWCQIGLDDEQLQKRVEVFKECIKGNFIQFYTAERDNLNVLKEIFAECLQEINQMKDELDVEEEIPPSNPSLIKTIKELKEFADKLRMEKKQRLEEHAKLLKKEKELTYSLGMSMDSARANGHQVPRLSELQEMRENIKYLIEERTQRKKKFLRFKQELTTIIEITELSPETSFEREIICYKDEAFVLSKENLDHMTLVIQKFQKRQKEIECEIDKAKSTLKELWRLLDIPEDERKYCQEKFSNYCQTTLYVLNGEIDRCNLIKEQMMRECINNLRDKIMDLWEKCRISQEDRLQFKDFWSEECTNDLLRRYGNEVNRLEKFHREREMIFAMIEKRKTLWQMMLDLESNANNPDRYFNRKANLLLEEKKRNRLLKQLAALEKKIQEAIAEYDKNNDCMFLIDGKNFADLIAKQCDHHIQEKENKKLERHRQRTLQAEAASSTKIPMKRKFIATPSSSCSKMARLDPGESFKPSRKRAPLAHLKNNIKGRLRSKTPGIKTN